MLRHISSIDVLPRGCASKGQGGRVAALAAIGRSAVDGALGVGNAWDELGQARPSVIGCYCS